jgi:ornithine cyclodeaminase/alanine dehydrogenase-like protein (mu-crystallin family)
LKPAGTLLLTRRDVASLLDLDRCIAAVEEAFRLRGEGKTPPPGILGFPAAGGAFREPFLGPEDVAPGTFLAAVGSDSADKQEIDPAILAAAKVVADSLEQCAEIGEIHHALASGTIERSDVYAELSEIAAGRKPGRVMPEEVTVFDSTGTALQDVAAAAAVYEKAMDAGRGLLLDFAG